MSKFFSLKALIPLWLVTFALVAVFVSPMRLTSGALLVIVGLVVPAVTILLWKDQQPPTVAQVLHQVEQATKR